MHSSSLLRLRTATFGLLTAFCSTVSSAQDATLQQYEVELVVFRVANPSHSAEDWTLEARRAAAALPATTVSDEPLPTSEPSSPASPASPAAPPAPATGEGSDSTFQPIEVTQFRMAQIEAALRRNRNYQVVAHVAWLQPGFAMNNPRPLSLEGLVPADTGLSGTVSMVRGRYLHMGLDLALQAGDQRYILREQRRMRRSGEKHYFDHPVFGVIALVTPKDSR